MTARVLVLVAALGVAGCDAATTVLLDVSLRAGDPAPVALRVGVYGPEAVLAHDKVVPLSSLPGTLVLRGLPAGATPLRIGLVDIDGRVRGAATVTSALHRQVEVPVVLSGAVGDADGDGVPDPIDVCPNVADPAQQTDASGQGLACGGVVPDGFVPLDLAEPTDLGGDAGSRDLAGADLAKPYTACPGGYLLCEGFEAQPAKQSFLTTSNLGAENVDATRAAYGLRGERLSCDVTTAPAVPASCQAQLYESTTFPEDPLYVRFSLYLPSNFPTLSVNLVQLRSMLAPFPTLVFGFDGRTPWMGTVNVQNGPGKRRSGASLPIDRWVCLELKLSTNGSQAWLNDVELTDVALGSFSMSQAFDTMLIGLDTSVPANSPTAFQLWVDEIAVDAKRIGCLP